MHFKYIQCGDPALGNCHNHCCHIWTMWTLYILGLKFFQVFYFSIINNIPQIHYKVVKLKAFVWFFYYEDWYLDRQELTVLCITSFPLAVFSFCNIYKIHYTVSVDTSWHGWKTSDTAPPLDEELQVLNDLYKGKN